MNKTKQLIHIKQLYVRAEQLAKKDDDVSLIMLVQLLDFIVELLLKLAIHSFKPPMNFLPPQKGYYYKISILENERYKPNMDFYRAWDEVVGIVRESMNNITISDLPLRRDMDRLHEIRNDVQHKGAIPSPKEVTKFIPLVESFLVDIYIEIFKEDFEKLSAVSLIADTQVREKIESAYDKLEKIEWTDAVYEATIAFHLLIQKANVMAYAKVVWDKSHIREERYEGRVIDFTSNGQKQFNKNTMNELNRLKDHIVAIGFGMDYDSFVTLEPILPEVEFAYSKENEFVLRAKPDWIYSEEHAKHIQKTYTEEEAKMIVKLVEKQALEFHT